MNIAMAVGTKGLKVTRRVIIVVAVNMVDVKLTDMNGYKVATLALRSDILSVYRIVLIRLIVWACPSVFEL
jgi:hypothetical protein